MSVFSIYHGPSDILKIETYPIIVSYSHVHFTQSITESIFNQIRVFFLEINKVVEE